AQTGEAAAVPGKEFIRLALDRSRVRAERDSMIVCDHAPDAAAAKRVRRDIELVERRRFHSAPVIDRAEGAAKSPMLAVDVELELGRLRTELLHQGRASILAFG